MWLLGITFTVASQASYFRSIPLAAMALLALVMAWLVCMVLRRAPAVLFAAVAAITSLGAEINTIPDSICGPNPPFVTWVNLATMMLGFLMPKRAGRSWVGATAVVSWVLGLLLADNASPGLGDWTEVTTSAIYALVIGIAASSAIAAIRRAAESDDDSARALNAATAAAGRENAARSETFRICRSVHDGPLNTFAAIRMGHAETGQLEQRCAADSTQIDRLLAGRDFSGPALGQTCRSRIIAAATARAT